MAFILQNTNYASVFFGANSPQQTMYRIPRVKYMYYANFEPTSEAVTMFPNLYNTGKIENGVSFKIKTIDKPNVDLQQRELNQYNRKRYAYTKTEYKPVTVSIYDTVDNAPLNLWIEYFNYYFGDARNKSFLTMQSSTVDPKFDDGTGWGLRPLVNQIYFFTRLNIYAFYNRKYTLTSYLNPKISGVDFGNHDTSSSDLEDFRLTISYETLQYSSGDITASLATQFGFDSSPYIEPRYTQTPTISKTEQTVNPYRLNLDGNSTRPTITSPGLSVPSNSGVSVSGYATALATLSNIAGRPGINSGKISGTQVYPSAVGASNSVYGTSNGGRPGLPAAVQPGVGGNPSDVPIPENYGLTGLPNGQLPDQNQYLPLANQPEFVPVHAIGAYNLLGSFGSFNFGGVQVVVSLGSNGNGAYNRNNGFANWRPGMPHDSAYLRGQPVHIPGQRWPNQRPGYHDNYNTNYGQNGPRYLTQYQQLEQARRRVQQGEVSLTISIGDPTYDDYGIYTGYDQARYQPVPDPTLSVSLSLAAALSNNTISGFVYLDDPYVYGGDPDDNLPPPTIYPYVVSDPFNEDIIP